SASAAALIPAGMVSTVPQLGHLIFRPAKVAFAWRKTPQEQWNEIDMARTPTFFPLSGRHPRAREGHGRYFARRILRVRSAYLISRLGGLASLFRRDVRRRGGQPPGCAALSGRAPADGAQFPRARRTTSRSSRVRGGNRLPPLRPWSASSSQSYSRS